MASTPTGMPGRQQPSHLAPASPRSDAASGHDTDSTTQTRSSKRKYSHTTEAQRQYLLEWLELPGNFALLTKPVKGSDPLGVAPSSSPAPKRVRKTDGYRSLAQYMNRVALTEWTEKTARSRFESFMAAYRKAKWKDPQGLSAVYRRVDALFGPDGDVEGRLRSSSIGQRSEGGRSPGVREVDQDMVLRPVLAEEQTSSPPRRRARTSRSFEEVIMTSTPTMSADAKEEAVASPMQELAITSSAGSAGLVSEQSAMSVAVNDEALRVESQRLAVRQQELELKQSELRARQEENRQKLRAEVLTRLVEAGKSPAEVREYLAIMDPADNPPRR